MSPDLWPSQERGIQAVIDAIAAGERRICLTAPTGGGKTRIMCELIERMNEPTVLYTNRRMLLEQTAERLASHGIEFGIRAAGHESDISKRVQLAMIQTEDSRVFKRERTTLHWARLVLVDEAHVNGAGAAARIIGDHLKDNAALVGFTATPLGIGHLYDHLVVAGNPSELRRQGHLLAATVYAPDEPDARGLKHSVKTGEFTEAAVRKAIMTKAIFGRVFDHWQKYNPDALPAILFAPGVAESIWFCEQFAERGVRCAHIDGEKCWLDGEEIPSSQEARDHIADLSRSGEIAIVCNRFVLREGIDWPWLFHGVLATAFGSLTSYLQSVGRLLRASPNKDRCVARDSVVLTDKGLVRIQDITLEHRVWDGIDFVEHAGAICNGIQCVITWDGLTATPDHEVHTQHGWTTIAKAARLGLRLTRTGVCGEAIRVPDDSNPHDSGPRPTALGRGRLQSVWQPLFCSVSQDRATYSARVQALCSAFRRALPRVDLSAGAASVATLQRPKGHWLPLVWWAWNRISLFVDLGRDEMDRREPWGSRRPITDHRPNRERRSLRAGQPSLGHGIAANEESPAIQTAEVWDIADAGPRNRFTASGVLVANCIITDHGGNWHRHGSPNADRQWDLSDTAYRLATERQERMRQKKEPEPITCPRCHAVRLSGPECFSCGFRHSTRSRMVIQQSGRLVRMDGDIYRERPVSDTPQAEKDWKSVYFRLRNAKRDFTFKQALGLFAKEHHGKYPPRDLPLMPLSERDWQRRIKDVPYSDLVQSKKTPDPQKEMAFQ